MNTWQIVHSDGEIDDIDDASSVSSGWSVMDPDEVVKEKIEFDPDPLKFHPITSESAQGGASLCQIASSRLSRKRRRGDRRRVSEPSSVPSLTAATFAMANTSRGGTSDLMSGGHTASAVLRSLARIPVSSSVTNRHNRAVQFNRNSTALNIDRQHSKCLIGGAMTSKGYQRQQQFRTVGGQILRGHKTKA